MADFLDLLVADRTLLADQLGFYLESLEKFDADSAVFDLFLTAAEKERVVKLFLLGSQVFDFSLDLVGQILV